MRQSRLIFAATALTASLAHGDTWLLPRHDAQRTAAASGTVSLLKPTVGWRTYVGAPVTASTGAFDPSDGAVFYAVTGGKVVARRITTQQILWQSALLGVTTLAGAADLDGDGKFEVVVFAPNEAIVLSGSTGAVAWRSSRTDYGYVYQVRLADLNRDGKTDVLIDDCGFCAKVGKLVTGAYSFAAGLSQPKTLWSVAAGGTKAPYHAGSDSIVNLNDQSTQVVLSYGDEVQVLRGDTGAVLSKLTIPAVGPFTFAHVPAITAQLDGTGSRELLVVKPTSADDGQRAITAFRVDANTGTSSLMWRSVLPDGGATSVPLDLASDIDGDGADEVILSGFTSGSWTTKILDGKTGTIRFELAGARFEGATNLDGAAGVELVTAAADGLSAYAVRAGTLTRIAGPLAGYRAASIADATMRTRGPLSGRLASTSSGLAIGLPHGKTPYANLGGVGALDRITFATVTGAGWQLGSAYAPGVGHVTEAFIVNGATRPYVQLATGTSFGALEVLDNTLHVTNVAATTQEVIVGTLVGGTTSLPSPLVSKDASGPFVVVPSPRASRSVVDAREASLVVAPKTRWEADLGLSGVLDLGGALGQQLVSIDGYDLVARRTTDGVESKRVALGIGGIGSSGFSLAPLRVAGRADPLVAVDWETTAPTVVQKAIDLSAGLVLWSSNPIAYGGFFGSSVADLNGDGTDEWYSMTNGLTVRQASDGSAVKDTTVDTGYSAPIAADFSGGGKLELLHQGGTEVQLMRADRSIVWKAGYVEPSNGRFGTRVNCPSGAAFVTPAVQSAWVRWYDGKTGAVSGSKVAAGGALFDSTEAATTAGKTPGELSHISSVADLASKGPAVFFGSTDGYLYAVDACTRTLAWSIDLGAPVGDPVVANQDDDVDNEVLVNTSNGFVHVLDVPRCEGVSVVSLAGPSATQRVAAGTTLTATWPAAQDATKYDVGLVNSDNVPVWNPAFREASGTTFTFNTDGLLANRLYRAVVRPTSQVGACAETFSAEFLVTDDIPPTGALSAAFGSAGLGIRIDASDNLALDHFTLGWRLPGEQALTSLSDQLLNGRTGTASITFTPPEPSKSIELVLEVFDSANLSTRVTLTASPKGTPPPPPGDGCDCSTGPSRSPGFAEMALLLLTMVWVKRRIA
jgi:hypothetical protein